MRFHSILSSLFLMTSTIAYAGGEEIIYVVEEENFSTFAIQGTISTKGNIGLGITHYTEQTEIGMTFSGLVDNNGHEQTKIFTPVLYAGFRKPLAENTYLALGLDMASAFGRDEGKHIDADIQIGPYLALEQELTSRLLLVGWIDVYNYEYLKEDGVSISTNRIFASGGLGFSYYI